MVEFIILLTISIVLPFFLVPLFIWLEKRFNQYIDFLMRIK